MFRFVASFFKSSEEEKPEERKSLLSTEERKEPTAKEEFDFSEMPQNAKEVSTFIAHAKEALQDPDKIPLNKKALQKVDVLSKTTSLTFRRWVKAELQDPNMSIKEFLKTMRDKEKDYKEFAGTNEMAITLFKTDCTKLDECAQQISTDFVIQQIMRTKEKLLNDKSVDDRQKVGLQKLILKADSGKQLSLS